MITLTEMLEEQSKLFEHICKELTEDADNSAEVSAGQLGQNSEIVSKIFIGSCAGGEAGAINFEEFKLIIEEVKQLLVRLEQKRKEQEAQAEAERKAVEEDRARQKEEERRYQQAQAELKAQQLAEEDERKRRELEEEMREAKEQRAARRQAVLAEREAKQAAEEEQRRLDLPMQQLFDLIDADHSGLVTLPEFKASSGLIVDYLTTNKIVPEKTLKLLQPGRLVSIFSHMDSDGSGVLDFLEFKGVCNHMISHCEKLAKLAKTNNSEKPTDAISMCFTQLDKDNSGALSMYEIVDGAPAVLASMGMTGSQMSMVRVTKIFKQISKGHSDVVTLDQFRQMINKLKEVYRFSMSS